MITSLVMAGMVLYKSDYNRLVECLRALDSQVESTIIYDNSPQEMGKKQQEYLINHFKCEYIFSGENLGMPGAMNKILEIGDEKGFQWVLTMNADSIAPVDLIDKYSPYFEKEDIGIICPQVVDRRRKYIRAIPNADNRFIDICITSGACMRIDAWKQVGKFDEWLFVDLLDNDISKRMILNKWKIYQIGSVVLDHEFGDIQAKRKWEENFWLKAGEILKSKNIAKFSYKKIVHADRVFYTCRNIVYLNKKFMNYGGIGYENNYNCHTFVGFIICFVLPSILRANKKIEVIKAVQKGFAEGKSKARETSPWQAKAIA